MAIFETLDYLWAVCTNCGKYNMTVNFMENLDSELYLCPRCLTEITAQACEHLLARSES